jgi:Domain of unknown function (DUF4326)
MPERIQLRRTKGFRLRDISPDAIVVSRPTIFGNPWSVGRENGSWHVYQGPRRCWTAVMLNDRAVANIVAVGHYRSWLKYNRVPGHSALKIKALEHRRAVILVRLPYLAGRDLACWCAPDQPCHADVLLELANQEASA